MTTTIVDLDQFDDEDVREEAESRGLLGACGADALNAAYEDFRNDRLDKDKFLRELFYSALGKIA